MKNRFIRSATFEGIAGSNDATTDRMTELLVDLVKGGVGFLISGHAYVTPEGQAGKLQLGVYSDQLKESLSKMAETTHQAGGKILMQISHSGCQALPEMSAEDIDSVVLAFGEAARKARDHGFDGV